MKQTGYDSKDLEGLSGELKAITKQVERLIRVVKKLEKAQAAEKRKAEAQATSRRKVALRKKAAAQKAADRVINIVKRSQKAVGVPALMRKTGYDEKKVRNIVSTAFKQGKIKRAGQGVYVSASPS
jgi:alcohol dehydrogenase class IV